MNLLHFFIFFLFSNLTSKSDIYKKNKNKKMLKNSFFKTKFNLSVNIDRDKPFKAKDGKLWAISKENFLICIKYLNLGKIQELTFPEITDIYSIRVCENSSFCAALTKGGVFVVNSETRQFYKFTEDQTITSIGWLNSTEFSNPILFMAHETHIISYCEVFSNNQFKILDFGNRNFNPITGIIAAQLSNENSYEIKYGLVLIEKNSTTPYGINICPYVLNENFTLVKENLKTIQGYSEDNLPHLYDSPYIAISSSLLGYAIFGIQMRLDQIIPSALLGYQEMIQVDEKPLWINIFSSCIFIQTESGVYIYDTEKRVNEKSTVIAQIDLTQKLDLDPKHGCFIVLEDDNSLYIYQFSEKYFDSRGFYYWIFNNTKENDIETASSFLMKGNFHPLELYQISSNDNERFHIMNALLNSGKIKNTSMIYDIATIALESLIRNEIGKEDRDEEAFLQWAKYCVSKNYLSIKTIDKLLQTYGWSALVGRTQESGFSSFEGEMERGDLQAAANTLKTLSKRDFITCALRIFKLKPQEAVDAMFSTGFLDCKELIPLFLSDEAVKYLPQLLVPNNLKQIWQRNVVAIIITKVNDEQERSNYAQRYVSLIHFNDYDFNFALRYWLEKGLNDIVATSMITTGKLQDAIIAAPDKIFDVLKEMNDDEKRRQIAIKLLKSLDTENSQQTAEKLLNDEIGPKIGIDILLNYLPDKKPIRSLIPSLDLFFTDLETKEDDFVQKRLKASTGIRQAHKQQSTFKSQSLHPTFYNLSEDGPCKLCGKPFPGEPFVYFNCNHYFHKKCLENHIQRIGIPDSFDVTSTCPLCGCLSAFLIDLPYDNFNYQQTETTEIKQKADPWSVDAEDLNALATKQKSNKFILNSNLFKKWIRSDDQ